MKFLFLFITYVSFLYSSSLEAKYEVSYGSIATLGYAKTVLEKKEHTYYIRIEANTTGFAKALSNNRQEIFESRGKVINNILVPSTYIQTKKTNSYTKIKRFRFDHPNKVVHSESIHQYADGRQGEYFKDTYKYYAPNDTLTLYFNIIELLKDSKELQMVFYAIGGRKDDGRIDVIRPIDEELESLKSLMDLQDDETLLKIIIHQDIFSSENGALLVKLDNQKNICTKAVLENVLLFGDIVGEILP